MIRKTNWIESTYGQCSPDRVLTRLKDICVADSGIQTGPFGSQLHREDYVEEGIPIITVEHLGDNRVNSVGVPMISRKDADRLSRFSLLDGDIVFSRVGSVDRRALISWSEVGWLFSGRCLRVRPNRTRVDSTYLSYFFGLPSFKAHIRAIAVGATMPSLNTRILSDIQVPLPPMAAQQKIAGILSAYDDLIENNNRRIKLLEEMAQRIYREWFVDYRYPGHEAVPLVDSELGLIPEGWSIKRLGDEVELVYGKALKSESRMPGGVTVFGSGGPIGTHDEALGDGPTVIVGRKGNVGAVSWSDGPFFAIDTAYWVRSELPMTYCFYVLRDAEFLDSHAAVPGLSREQAYSLLVLVPNDDVLDQFESMIRQAFSLRRHLNETNTNLRASRNLLLPRLISGEIDVTDLNIVPVGTAA